MAILSGGRTSSHTNYLKLLAVFYPSAHLRLRIPKYSEEFSRSSKWGFAILREKNVNNTISLRK